MRIYWIVGNRYHGQWACYCGPGAASKARAEVRVADRCIAPGYRAIRQEHPDDCDCIRCTHVRALRDAGAKGCISL